MEVKRWAGVACAIFLAFALFNGFKLQATVMADQAQARADRSTTGTVKASADLDRARDKRDAACDTKKPTQACEARKSDVTKLENVAGKATVAVATTARPEVAAFRNFVVWASLGAWKPTETDFDNWWLLLRLIVLQMGGPVLRLARR
jgi:hypothetical protein